MLAIGCPREALAGVWLGVANIEPGPDSLLAAGPWSSPCRVNAAPHAIEASVTADHALTSRTFAAGVAGGATPVPLHFRYMPETGACGKPRVMPHSHRP